jgi:thymidylate synthase ThyX
VIARKADQPTELPSWLEDRRKLTEGPLETTYSFSREDTDRKVTGLTRDVAFNRHSINDGEHVSPFDNGRVQIGTDGIDVALVQGIDVPAFHRTLSAATRATIGIDIEPKWEPCPDDEGFKGYVDGPIKVTGIKCSGKLHEGRGGVLHHLVDPLDQNEDWEEMLRGGLQTALETQVIVFAVKGVSRTATHQLVRSRRAAFHQQSQRASWMGDFPECRMPESVWVNERARAAFFNALIACHTAYRIACDEDISYQDARFILPEGTCNFILLEYPVREFLKVYAYRACSMFQWEIVQVMRLARQVLVKDYPWLKPYIKISCQDRECPDCGGRGRQMLDDDHTPSVPCTACGGTGMVGSRCTFQGWENVEGQCSFSWAREELRTFKPRHHKIERKALT